uniref:Ankyrin repeat domain 9 n=1 Tax=Equus asinus TaxID=9793 RepID=A0A9L0I817_EQUAS
MPWDARRPGGGARTAGPEGAGAARSRAQKQCRKSSFAFYQAVRDLLPVWLLEDMRASEAFHWDERGRAAAYSPSEALLYALVHDHQAYAHYLLATFPRRALAPPSAGFRCCAAPGPHVALAVRYNRVGILRRILRTVRDFRPRRALARVLDRRRLQPRGGRRHVAARGLRAGAPRVPLPAARPRRLARPARRRRPHAARAAAAPAGGRDAGPPPPPPGRPRSRAPAPPAAARPAGAVHARGRRRPGPPRAAGRPAALAAAAGRGQVPVAGGPGATLALRARHAGAGHRHLSRPLPRGPGRAAAAALPAAAGPHGQGLDRGDTLGAGFLENTIFQSVVPGTLHILISARRNLPRLSPALGAAPGRAGGPHAAGFLGPAALSAPPPCAERA